MNRAVEPESPMLAEAGATQETDLPRRFCIELPQPLLDLSEQQRRHRALCTADDAVLDDCRFFARGQLCLPIQGQPKPFCYDCWVELREQSHLVVVCAAKEADRETLAPLPASLANCLPPFYDTMGLAGLLVFQPVGQRPNIILTASSHLTRLQHDGLTPAEFQALAIDLLQGRSGALANLKS